MEPMISSRRDNIICPIKCAMKASLLAIVAIFVLYFPLGDPLVHCHEDKSLQSEKLALCCLCDIYFMSSKNPIIRTSPNYISYHLIRDLSRVVSTTMKWTEVTLCVLVDMLYEAKLMFYNVLGKLDRQDLCRSVCCSESMDDLDKKGERRFGCKCVKKCSKNKIG